MSLINCACGCGTRFEEYDSRNRKRRFVSGHNKSTLGKCTAQSIAKCKTCGKEFLYHKTKTRGIFCSKECQFSFDYPGCIWEGKNGYLYYQKGRRGKKLLLHRLLMGAREDEVVHHIDENKLNNDLSNLELLEGGQSEHIKIHRPHDYRG